MDLELRHLRLVDAITREKGVTRAAEKLNLTQSALSHQLKEVEDRLGCQLFARYKRKMVLTPAGEMVLETARSVLVQMQRTEETIKRLASGQSGSVRITTQCNTCYHWLPNLIRIFNKRYPDVEVVVNVEATSDPLKSLLNGELDIAVMHTPVRDKGLVVEPLFADELIALMPPGHRLAGRNYLSPRDFEDEHLIVYNLPNESNLIFRKVLMPVGIHPRKVTHVMLTEAIVEMVKAGIGITVLARWFAAPYLRSGALKGVRVTRSGLLRNWNAVMIASPSIPPHLMEFARMLANNSVPAVLPNARGRTIPFPA